MAGAKIVGIHGGSRANGSLEHSSKPLSPALVQLRELSKQHLQGLLRKLFDSADDALFAMADNAGSNNEQSTYFDAMRELRLQKKHIAVSVIKTVIRSYNELGHYRVPSMSGASEQSNIEELSLVNNEELEINVAVEGMVGRLRSTCSWPLECLHIRFEELNYNKALELDQVPASPEILCAGFVAGCSELDIDIRAQLVVLKLFERFVLSDMPSFYDESNKLLVQLGIKPNIERGGAHRRVTPNLGTQSADGQNPLAPNHSNPRHNASHSEYPAQAPLLAAESEINAENGAALGLNDTQLQELLGLLRQSQQLAPPLSENVPTLSQVVYSQAELVGALDKVQAQLQSGVSFANRQNTQNYQTTDYHALLSEHWGREPSELEFEEHDADVMNLVSMLFEFFLEDRQLQVDMKALIGRLQIPILKVALMDRSFFARGGHPARKLLNEIASAALGWNPPEAGRPDRLKEKIESVVERVVSDFGQDLSLFEVLLHEFSQFVDLERRRGQLVEQRTKDSEQGKAASVVARKAVQDELNRLIKGHRLPLPVKAMLSDAWSSVMLLHYLKSGDTSSGWLQACTVVEQLLWTLDPEPYYEASRTRFKQTIDELNQALEAGLKDVAYDEFKVKAWLSALANLHAQKLQELDDKLLVDLAPQSDEEDEAISALLVSTLELEQDFNLHQSTDREPANDSQVPPAEAGLEQLPSDDVNVITNVSGLEVEERDGLDTHRSATDEQVPLTALENNSECNNEPELVNAAAQAAEEPLEQDIEQESEEIVLVTADFGEQDEASIEAAKDDPFVKQVEHFVTGCWFEFDNEGHTQRCKLAAIIKSTGKYIFVNRAGVKVTEKTKMGLAVELRRGSLQVLNDGLLFDRALESIITSLRSRKDD